MSMLWKVALQHHAPSWAEIEAAEAKEKAEGKQP